MKHMLVKQSATINAPIEQVYAVIADYEVGHRAILPKPYFQSMEILNGGFGEGTELKIEMDIFGVKASYHQLVTEPVKGRQIVERDMNTNLASTFTLVPLDNGTQTQVTIVAEVALSDGFQAIMERLFNPLIIGHIFKKELQNLDDYVTHKEVIQAIM